MSVSGLPEGVSYGDDPKVLRAYLVCFFENLVKELRLK